MIGRLTLLLDIVNNEVER
jgi:hypothetical protein